MARHHGRGKRYRHDYDNVAVEMVWRTIKESLAALRDAVEREISRLDDNGNDGAKS